jgi:thiol:disulfide interchange protein
MTMFRRWMALPMALTALALVWLASRVAGSQFAAGTVVLAVLLLALLWFAGRRQRRGQPSGLLLLAGTGLLATTAFALLPTMAAAPVSAAQGVLPSEPFSEARLASARASGKPVFVWMTADWCITCKVNEQAAIEREETAAAFRKANVIVLRGDWTRRDAEITRYLTAHGAAGVPFYQWYPAGGAAPEQLPQILTKTLLVDLAQTELSRERSVPD